MKIVEPPRKAGFTLVEIMVVVVIIGILASLAFPYFAKIRATSQDKAVLNNARQLAWAAEQYYTMNGVTTADITDLVGTDKYVKNFSTIANEIYPTTFQNATPIVVTNISGQRTLTYQP